MEVLEEEELASAWSVAHEFTLTAIVRHRGKVREQFATYSLSLQTELDDFEKDVQLRGAKRLGVDDGVGERLGHRRFCAHLRALPLVLEPHLDLALGGIQHQ